MTVTCRYLLGTQPCSCQLFMFPSRTGRPFYEEWFHVRASDRHVSTMFKLVDLLLGPGGYRQPSVWCGLEGAS